MVELTVFRLGQGSDPPTLHSNNTGDCCRPKALLDLPVGQFGVQLEVGSNEVCERGNEDLTEEKRSGDDGRRSCHR